MSYKNRLYKNKVKSLVSIAGVLVIIAAIGSMHVSNDHVVQGQESSPVQTNDNNNTVTQVQVGGGNATYPFFGYSP